MIIAIDTETGGLNAFQACGDMASALLTIGAVAYDMDKDVVVDCFSVIINPDTNLKIEKQALDVNNLSLSLLQEDGQHEAEAMFAFESWLDGLSNQAERFIPLGHNIQFDLNFLLAASNRSGIHLKRIQSRRHIETYTCAAMLRLPQGKLNLATAIDQLASRDDFLPRVIKPTDNFQYTEIIQHLVNKGPQCHVALQDACYSLALFRYIDSRYNG